MTGEKKNLFASTEEQDWLADLDSLAMLGIILLATQLKHFILLSLQLTMETSKFEVGQIYY